mmetsp:Transcript_19041/g.60912  ORF Transcript_19041/g.60912 Transcript_19041/m.60912 type:complete len:253 (-) Transcript_19041:223-981(-)
MLSRAATLLGQRAAQELDVELMSSPGFSIDQLMELAGLSVACAIAAVWPPAARLLLVCGPGNNGGDGLVASRHLYHFGYKPTVLYPKPPKDDGAGTLYKNLLAQLDDLNITVLTDAPDTFDSKDYDVVVDAVFGFSFDPTRGFREPFDKVMNCLVDTDVPVAAVDIPSGWHVEKGDITGTGYMPEMLISLTAPKQCATHFTGPHHFLGGRFVPPHIANKYNITGLPGYPGVEQCVRLPPFEPEVPGGEDCKI